VKKKRNWSYAVNTLSSFVAGAILWEAVARLLVRNALFFPPLTDVFSAGFNLAVNGSLASDTWISLREFLGGFGLAVAVGIGLGVLLAASNRLRMFVDPWISMLYATPTIALGPLFILTFGIGLVSKIAIIFLMAVFPMIINTVSGLTTTDETLIEVTRSFGATPTQVYTKVRLPAALPYIIAGLRLGVARALVGVVVAELFGARGGLGFLVLTSAQSFDSASLFAAVLVLAVAGVVSVESLKWLEVRLAPWRFRGNSE
jgi:NitT/TauT family transport system permease protein